MSEHLYDSLPQALAAAYRTHDKCYVKTSRFFAELRGATVASRPKSEMTPMDWIAQAGLIVGKVRRTLDGTRHVLVVEARYIPGTTPEGRDSRETACFYLGEHLRSEFNYDRWWMKDVVRRWAGAKPQHTDEWWARHKGVEVRTLWNWRNKGPKGDGGIVQKLDQWLEEAHMMLYPEFSGGIIP